MISFLNERFGKCNIVQNKEEFPRRDIIHKIYADFETCNIFDGLHPYNGDRACGIGILIDDEDEAYYIPYRHSAKHWNLKIADVLPYLRDIFRRAEIWVNQNVKFDAHFLYSEGIRFQGQMHDTSVMSKMLDSDRLTHSLKPLCADWLKYDPKEKDRVESFLQEYGYKKKADWNWADVPADILGEYCCVDVFLVRALESYCIKNTPTEMKAILEQEHSITPVLFDIENAPLHVSPNDLKLEKFRCLSRLIELQSNIEKLCGCDYTGSSKNLTAILIGMFNLPVLARSDKTGRPSFSKKVFPLYYSHIPEDRKETRDLLDWISEYRKLTQYAGLYLDSLLHFQVENRIHPSYNQLVRTGRMSGREPNMQQFSKDAKRLILPENGKIFSTWDASQMEFRMIVHYIKDENAIAAYKDDPTTDFHLWMAELCDIQRKLAKNMNFMLGFGGGEKKTLAMLIMVDSSLKMEDAQRIYSTYHHRFPGIKKWISICRSICISRGYIKNCYGRRRHLKKEFANKAFNTVIQSTASDFVKSKLLSLSPRTNKRIRDAGLDIKLTVHDSITFQGTPDAIMDPDLNSYIERELMRDDYGFRVPILWDREITEKNLRE